jgi:predicted MFS family arabinose efflux permease
MYSCMIFIYFLTMYNYSTFEGDLFNIGILFGVAEVFGILVGEKFVADYPDWLTLIVSVLLASVFNMVVKMPGIPVSLLYLTFLLEMVCVGILYNSAFVIMESRTNPRHIQVAFEINLSFGNALTMLCPIIAKKEEPIPSLVLLSFGLVCVFMALKIGPERKLQGDIADKLE